VRSPDGSAPQDHSHRGAGAASNPSLKHPAQKIKQLPPVVIARRDRRAMPLAQNRADARANGLFWVNKKG